MHLPLATRTILKTDSRTVDAVTIKNGAIFAVLSTDAVTLWHAATLTQLHCTRRVTASLESTGFNRRIFLRSDEQVLIVQTAGNVLLIYDLCEDSDPEARSLKTLEFHGTPRMWLKHRQNIRVEAGVLALCATADCLIISTKRPAMIQSLFWHKHDGEVQTISQALKALTFLKRTETTIRVVEVLFLAIQHAYLWLTSDGNLYLVESHGDKWTGQCIYEAAAQGQEAVLATINDSQAVIITSLANSDLLTWSVSRQGSDLNTRLIYSYRCADSVGSIRSLAYSPDGLTLMICGETGWSLLTVYGGHIASRTITFERPNASDAFGDGSFEILSRLRCSIWICDGYSAVVFPLEEDQCTIEHFCVPAGMTLRCPRKLYANRSPVMSSDDSTAHDDWLAVLPSSDVEHLAPFKSHVVSPCHRFLAVTGKSGLAHYSRASELWKTHRNIEEAMEMTLVTDPIWYHHYLIVAIMSEDSQFEIRILSREFDVSDVLCRTTPPARPLILAVVNGQLYCMLANLTMQKFQIMRGNDGQIFMQATSSCHMPAQFAMSQARFRSLVVLHEAPDIQHAHLVALQGDVLSLLYFPDATSQIITSSTLAQRVDWMQVVAGTGRLRNAIFASSERSLKIWFNVLNHTDMTHDMPACSVEVNVDFIPLHVSVEAGLIEGVVVRDVNPILGAASSVQNLSYEARSFVPNVLQTLVETGLAGEAFVISTRYATCPQFTYYLELLLFRALENSTTDADEPLRNIWSLLEKHNDFMPEVVVACARKSEITTWNLLFNVVGPPLSWYQTSLSRGDLKTAGAYLVILLTMDTTLLHKDYTLDLIARAIDQESWDLAIELTRFYSVVTSDKQGASTVISALLRDSAQRPLKLIT